MGQFAAGNTFGVLGHRDWKARLQGIGATINPGQVAAVRERVQDVRARMMNHLPITPADQAQIARVRERIAQVRKMSGEYVDAAFPVPYVSTRTPSGFSDANFPLPTVPSKTCSLAVPKAKLAGFTTFAQYATANQPGVSGLGAITDFFNSISSWIETNPLAAAGAVGIGAIVLFKMFTRR